MGQGREHHTAALDMLEALRSVGATHFDLTWTDGAGKAQLFRRGHTQEELSRSMPVMLDKAIADKRNLIVRPHAGPAVFLQLDDLDTEALRKVRAAAFLILDTSPGNHQAWVALAADADDDFCRRVRKGAGADPTASGATRVAGSLNFKDKYAPDFPRVTIGHVAAGRIMTPASLESMGLVAPAEPRRPPRAVSYASGTGARKWPDYQRCLDGAPANHGGSGPDVSRADFTWCMTAASWGFGTEDIARKLGEESTKARENGQRYALLTATRASAAARRNAKATSNTDYELSGKHSGDATKHG